MITARFIWIRNAKKAPIACIAYDPRSHNFGWSMLADGDDPVKALARKIAIGRLKEHPFVIHADAKLTQTRPGRRILEAISMGAYGNETRKRVRRLSKEFTALAKENLLLRIRIADGEEVSDRVNDTIQGVASELPPYSEIVCDEYAMSKPASGDVYSFSRNVGS